MKTQNKDIDDILDNVKKEIERERKAKERADRRSRKSLFLWIRKNFSI